MIQMPSPQDYLDDMHAIGIPRLFQPQIDARERAAGIRRARQELARLHSELRQHRDSFSLMAEAQSVDDLKRQAAPLNLLLLLHEQLLAEVNDLEHSLSNGKPLPYSFQFGTAIFGDENAGEWHIGDPEHVADWGRIQQFKRRLDALRTQGQPLREQLGSLRNELEQLREKRQKAQDKLAKRRQKRFVLRRIALLLALIVGSGLVGYHYFDSNRDFSLVAIGLAVISALLIPIVILNWRDPRTRTARQQRRIESQMRDLQQESQGYRQRYQPLELQIKALEVHYERMMSSWEEARLVKQRLDAFMAEGEPLRQRVHEIRAELEPLRQRRDKLRKTLEERRKRGAFFARMLLHMLLALASGAVGYYLQTINENDYATIMYGLGAFFALLLPLAYIHWKHRDGKLDSQLRQVEAKMRQLQIEGKQVMKRYHPLELQIKTLIAHYKRLRAGLRNTPDAPDLV